MLFYYIVWILQQQCKYFYLYIGRHNSSSNLAAIVAGALNLNKDKDRERDKEKDKDRNYFDKDLKDIPKKDSPSKGVFKFSSQNSNINKNTNININDSNNNSNSTSNHNNYAKQHSSTGSLSTFQSHLFSEYNTTTSSGTEGNANSYISSAFNSNNYNNNSNNTSNNRNTSSTTFLGRNSSKVSYIFLLSFPWEIVI